MTAPKACVRDPCQEALPARKQRGAHCKKRRSNIEQAHIFRDEAHGRRDGGEEENLGQNRPQNGGSEVLQSVLLEDGTVSHIEF